MRQRGARKLPVCMERAFTLAEVIVAVSVLTVMAVSLYGGFSTGFMIIDSSREDLRATQILMQKAEAIRLCTYSSLSNCPISFVERYDPTGLSSSSSGAGTVYSGTITTNVATGIPDTAKYKTNMCRVIITLTWTNYYNKKPAIHQRQMDTYAARYGLQNYIWGKGP